MYNVYEGIFEMLMPIVTERRGNNVAYLAKFTTMFEQDLGVLIKALIKCDVLI